MIDGQLKTILDSITNTLKSEYQSPVKTKIEIVEQTVVDGSYLLTGISYEENEKQEKQPSARIKAIVYGDTVTKLQEILSSNNLVDLEGVTVEITGKPYMSPKEDLCIVTQSLEVVTSECSAKTAYEKVINQLKEKGEYDPSVKANAPLQHFSTIELIYHSNNYTEHNIAALENYLSVVGKITGNAIKLNKYPTSLSKPKDGFYSDFSQNMKAAHDSQEDSIVVFYTPKLRIDETHYLNRVNVARIGARLSKPFIVIAPTKSKAPIALDSIASFTFASISEFSKTILSKEKDDVLSEVREMYRQAGNSLELARDAHKDNAHQLKSSVRETLHSLQRVIHDEKIVSSFTTKAAIDKQSNKELPQLHDIVSEKVEICVNELKAAIHKAQANVANDILRAQVQLVENTSPDQSALISVKQNTTLIRDELVDVIRNERSKLTTLTDSSSSAIIAEKHFREEEFKSNNQALLNALRECIDTKRCEMVNMAQSSQYIISQESSSYRHATSDAVEGIKTDLVDSIASAKQKALSQVTVSQQALKASLISEPQSLQRKQESIKLPEGEITILTVKDKQEIEPSTLVKGDEILINTHNNSSRVVVIETINNKE